MWFDSFGVGGLGKLMVDMILLVGVVVFLIMYGWGGVMILFVVGDVLFCCYFCVVEEGCVVILMDVLLLYEDLCLFIKIVEWLVEYDFVVLVIYVVDLD